jgi:hypothetical protein
MSLVEPVRRPGRVGSTPAIAWAASVAETNCARDYEQLKNLIDARRIERGLTMRDLDVDAELADGYYSKLVAGMRNFGPKSLGAVLAALGVELHLVQRPDGKLST